MDTLDHFERVSERKDRRRTKKRRPSMRVSGKSVLVIQRTILHKAAKVNKQKKSGR